MTARAPDRSIATGQPVTKDSHGHGRPWLSRAGPFESRSCHSSPRFKRLPQTGVLLLISRTPAFHGHGRAWEPDLVDVDPTLSLLTAEDVDAPPSPVRGHPVGTWASHNWAWQSPTSCWTSTAAFERSLRLRGHGHLLILRNLNKYWIVHYSRYATVRGVSDVG